MASSDEEDERLPTEVSEYYFMDGNGEPVSFAELPLKWDIAEPSDNRAKEIGLRGKIDKGLQQYFEQVTAWRFDISSPQKPEFLVLTRKKNWIKLLKPKKSYEQLIRTVLITVQLLHYVKRNPETLEKALWARLAKVFSSFEPEPSERDLEGHFDLVSKAVERHEELKRSQVLVAFLEGKPVRKRVPSKEFGKSSMSSFIVDDFLDETIEDGSDDESDDFFEHVCAICDNGGDIVCCEGKCLRSFHPTRKDGVDSNCDSLGYSDEQFKEMENQTFVCKNCEFNQHQCFVCGKLGSSDKSAGAEVFQCVAGTCGYFYHPNCVAKALQFKLGDKAKDLEYEIAKGKTFMCPIHYCFRCQELEPEDKSDELMQFAVCRRCPKAYHRKCLPREIYFEDDEDEDFVQRAWKGLMPNKILMYCLKHEIDDELSTPIRNHIKFPGTDQTKEEQTSELVSKENEVSKKKKILSKHATGVKTEPKQLEVIKNPSLAKKKIDSTKTNEGKLSTREIPKKGKLADVSGAAFKKSLPRKVTEPRDGEGTALLGELLYNAHCKNISEAVKPGEGGTADTKERKRKGRAIVKDFNSSVRIDDDSKKRIHSILKEAESSITLEDIKKKFNTPTNSSRHMMYMQNMTLGKVEGSIEAIRVALQKLNEGGKIEDAKAVCEPGLLNQITKFRSKMKVFLAPFLHGSRYTSFGRHFTKVDKLQATVEKLHWYVEDGDMMVDFCCGTNEFSWLMKQKMDEIGKNCNFKNYDIFPTKNKFNFEQKDWFSVQPSDLPDGSKLIIGLNPPFGANLTLANKFIDKALQFKPKLLILIVPRETQRVDEKSPYDLIWEDEKLLDGKAFYLPGSIDAYDNQTDDWNNRAPLLSLWSRQDWTSKHMEIALHQGRLTEEVGKVKEEYHPQAELPDHYEEPHDDDCYCGSSPPATKQPNDGKKPNDNSLNDQEGCDSLEEKKKRSHDSASSDKQSPRKRSVPLHLPPKVNSRPRHSPQVEVEKGTESCDGKKPNGNSQKDQSGCDSLEEKKKRSHDSASDKQSPRKRPRRHSPSTVDSRPRHSPSIDSRPRLSPPKVDSRPRRSPPKEVDSRLRHSPPKEVNSRHRDLPKRSEISSHADTDLEREGYRQLEHGSELHMEREYGSYPDDRMARRNRWPHPVDHPGPDFHLMRGSAEPFVDYPIDPRGIHAEAYAREAERRAAHAHAHAHAHIYGHQNPGFAPHAGSLLAAPPPGFPPPPYRHHLGAAPMHPPYNEMRSSAMDRYALRLHESNSLARMSNMERMPDGRRGMPYPPTPHHGPGGYPVDFSHRPYPPLPH